MANAEEGPELIEGVEETRPIAELRDFSLPSDVAFGELVRERIVRREAASSLVDLATRGVLRLLLDYLSTILGVFQAHRGSDESGKES